MSLEFRKSADCQHCKLISSMGYPNVFSPVTFICCITLITLSSWLMGSYHLSPIWTCFPISLSYLIIYKRINSLLNIGTRRAVLANEKKKAMRSDESVEWLNFLLNKWWKTSADSFYRLLKFNVEPFLNLNKPNFLDCIELKEFTFGEDFVEFRNIRCWTADEDLTDKTGSGNSDNEMQAPRCSKKVLLEFDFSIHAPDFRLVFGAIPFGKMSRFGFDFGVEKVDLDGRLQVCLILSSDVPMPHIKGFTMTFLEKPDINFSICMLKTDIMEVPYVNDWLHALISAAIVENMVDPEYLYIQFAKSDAIPASSNYKTESKHAAGVLLVEVESNQEMGHINNSDGLNASHATNASSGFGWLSLRLRDGQRYDTVPRQMGVKWQHNTAFLVSDFQADTLKLKYKFRGKLVDKTLFEQDIKLASYSTLLSGHQEKVAITIPPSEKIKNTCQIDVKLRYFTLPNSPFASDETDSGLEIDKDCQSGVVHMTIVSGTGLPAMDLNGFSDPYCQVFQNSLKLKTTPFVLKSLNPIWNTPLDIITSNYNNVKLKFVVYDWDGIGMKDDLIGYGQLKFADYQPEQVGFPPEGEKTLRKHEGCIDVPLSLQINQFPSSSSESRGYITVKWCFTPIRQLENCDNQSLTKPPVMKKTSRTLKVRNFVLNPLSNSQQYDPGHETADTLEIDIIQAKDLEAKDSNGFSDPFCEVRRNKSLIYRTATVKKCLNPLWNERVVTTMTHGNDIIDICVWDRDPLFQRDFLGSCMFTPDQLQILSAKCLTENSLWFDLNNAKRGAIQLSFCINAVTPTPELLKEKNEEMGNMVNGTQSSLYPTESGSSTTADFASSNLLATPTETLPSDQLDPIPDENGAGGGETKDKKKLTLPTLVRTMQMPSKLLKRRHKRVEPMQLVQGDKRRSSSRPPILDSSLQQLPQQKASTMPKKKRFVSADRIRKSTSYH